jgi:hypothetical protein
MTYLQQNIGALELGAVLGHADSALEAGTRAMQGPTLNAYYCPHHIEDDLLEAVGQELAPTSRQLYPTCRYIEDGAFEATVIAGPSPYSGIPNHPMCRHIDDATLEASTRDTAMGYTRAVSPATRCV